VTFAVSVSADCGLELGHGEGGREVVGELDAKTREVEEEVVVDVGGEVGENEGEFVVTF